MTSKEGKERAAARALAILALRPGDAARALIASAYVFVVIAVYIAVKAVRDSLFLGRFGAIKLPYAIIGVAVGVSIFVAIYLRIARRVSPTTLGVGTLLFFAGNLTFFWWAARFDPPWLFPVVFVWGGIYGVVGPAQAWTLINDVFTTREAKRAFGAIGAGGIAGGICGGWLASWISPRIGTVNVMLVLAALLAAAAWLALVLGRRRLPASRGAERAPRHLPESLRLVAGSPHLRLIAAMVLLAALATAIADYQFQAIAASRLKGDTLTSFFGAFYAAVGAVSLALQLFLAGRLFRWIGLAGAILVMPLSMFGATVALIPTLSLWAAVLVKGSDTVLKHSIDRSSRELAYLPVSRTVKIHVKSAIDMVVDRMGDGLAGGLLLFLTGALALSVRGLAVVNLVFIALWTAAAIAVGRSYVGELSRSIAEGRAQPATWDEGLASAETIGALRGALASGDEARAEAALSLLAENPDWDLAEPLRKLAAEGSPALRARALAILLDPSRHGPAPGVGSTLDAEDKTLLAECIDLLVAEESDERRRITATILDRAGGEARGAWVALLLRRLGPSFRPFGHRLLEEMGRADAPANSREAAATAIGLLPAAEGYDELLPALLRDEDPAVACAAARSAGAVGGRALEARLLPLLARPATRRAARLALAAHGEEALDGLAEALRRPETAEAVRRAVPSVLERIGTPRAVAALVAALRGRDRAVAEAAASALERTRLRGGGFRPIETREALEFALAEARDLRRLREARRALDGAPGPATRLLAASLGDAAATRRAAVFRRLSLAYPARDMALCRRCLAEFDAERRSNAAELLDNLRPRAQWRRLLPLLEGDGDAAAARGDARAVVFDLLSDPEPWLRAVALAAAAELEPAQARAAADAARTDPDPRVRDAALALLRPRRGAADEDVPMSLIDKVLALRRLDLFAEIPAEQLSLVAAVAREATYAPGEVVCRQDDPPGDLILMLDGDVELERDGRPMGRLAPGEALGAFGLFEDAPRPVTARATVRTSALRLDRWGFEDVWTENPELARSLVRQLVRRIRRAAEAQGAMR